MTNRMPMHHQASSGDGGPVPASQAMSKTTADWYVARTKGQLQAYRAADGHWYLYLVKPDGRG